MANQEHLGILEQGIETWNAWRKQHREVKPDLSEADLRDWNLRGGYFSGANLTGANLSWADLREAQMGWVHVAPDYLEEAANLSFAQLEKSDCRNAHLFRVKPLALYAKKALFTEADFSGADLSQALMNETDMRNTKLCDAILFAADFQGADLREADLSGAHLHLTNLYDANLTGCRVAGIDAVGAYLDGAIQLDLNLSIFQLAPVIVDHLQIAQFIYLYQRSTSLQNVLDIGPSSKLVLLVGSFCDVRKHVLEAFKTALRQREIIPIFYDIAQENKLAINEIVRDLASLARCVVVDVSEPTSFLGALEPVLPSLPPVPLHFIMQAPKEEGVLQAFFETYPWVGEPQYYEGVENIDEMVGRYV